MTWVVPVVRFSVSSVDEVVILPGVSSSEDHMQLYCVVIYVRYTCVEQKRSQHSALRHTALDNIGHGFCIVKALLSGVYL